MNKLVLFTLIIFSFSLIKNEEKSIILTIPIEENNPLTFNLSIGYTLFNSSFFCKGTINSDSLFGINSEMILDNETKYQNKEGKIDLTQLMKKRIYGKIYKEPIIFNNTIKIGEFEYISSENFGFLNGVFILSHKELCLLKENNIISNKIITFSKTNISNHLFLNVNIGSKYNIKNLIYYDKCRMIENSFGCYLQKIIIGNSKEDLKNGKFLTKNIFNISMLIEFYNPIPETENYLIGNKTQISYIKEILQKDNLFNCSKNAIDNNLINCKSNKTAIFVFGNKGIKFFSLNIKELDEDFDHLYFGIKTIYDLNFIIDAENEEIILHTQDKDLMFDDITTTYWKYWILLLFFFILVFGIFVFYLIEKKGKYDIKRSEVLLNE